MLVRECSWAKHGAIVATAAGNYKDQEWTRVSRLGLCLDTFHYSNRFTVLRCFDRLSAGGSGVNVIMTLGDANLFVNAPFLDSRPYVKLAKGCLILPSSVYRVRRGLYTILGKAAIHLACKSTASRFHAT